MYWKDFAEISVDLGRATKNFERNCSQSHDHGGTLVDLAPESKI